MCALRTSRSRTGQPSRGQRFIHQKGVGIAFVAQQLSLDQPQQLGTAQKAKGGGEIAGQVERTCGRGESRQGRVRGREASQGDSRVGRVNCTRWGQSGMTVERKGEPGEAKLCGRGTLEPPPLLQERDSRVGKEPSPLTQGREGQLLLD